MEKSVFKIAPIDVEARRNLDLRSGDTVRVHLKIQEKGKTRIQIFEGVVIARKHGTEAGGTFTVRKVASGVGTEKIFPLYAPMIDKIEIVKRTNTRKSKLYYIREKAAREIRKKMKQMLGFEKIVADDSALKVEEDLSEGDENKDEAPVEEKAEEKTEVKEEVKEEKKEEKATEENKEEKKEEVKA